MTVQTEMFFVQRERNALPVPVERVVYYEAHGEDLVLHGMTHVNPNSVVLCRAYNGCLMGLCIGDLVWMMPSGEISYCKDGKPAPMGVLLSSRWVNSSTPEQYVVCSVTTDIPEDWVPIKERWINTDVQ